MMLLFLSLFFANVLIIPEGSSTSPVSESEPAAEEAVQTETEIIEIGVGTIVELKGEAKAVSVSGTRDLVKGDAVYKDETISTAGGSSVQIEFADESLFTISASSSVRIDDFVYDETANDGRFNANVAKGIFRFITGKIAKSKPENVEIEIPSGTIGIRGTIVVGEIEGEKCLVSLEVSEGDTAQHKVIVTSPVNGQMQQVEIAKGGFATVIEGRGQMPKPAFQLPEADRNRFQQKLPPPQFLPRGEDGRAQHSPKVPDPRMSMQRKDDQQKPPGGPNGPGGGNPPDGPPLGNPPEQGPENFQPRQNQPFHPEGFEPPKNQNGFFGQGQNGQMPPSQFKPRHTTGVQAGQQQPLPPAHAQKNQPPQQQGNARPQVGPQGGPRQGPGPGAGKRH